jgi:hypothetical protein
MPRDEDFEDTILELVTSEYWRAIKKHIIRQEQGLIAQLCVPIQSIQDVFGKEAKASRLAALRQFVNDLEEIAERRAQQRRGDSGLIGG